ncbi:aminoglycoside phosphotransferase family protein [Dolichospermum sp. ST_sed1]|nr:aminoglycoside phosphotransferase family protein [Dolichospermum sp. ST_sed1]MDD1428387.1 aminoglycoside phosphotransferase family protein [Dolichospermum sp. ST_sed9]MDD1433314.1 aminoglycoside phosphotransferase family protein [Dolichospermum sp. ST_sed6]MDD1436366.1 aminoglycoside phosphotransferase family protein [Dolichospermum sp. ST_sed10]MDD1442687.1 aminoglycoside phosphotransferase family protein [Dolichospermum sp. ST_sed3]MDD1448660.1 aminoglycoside phosphotransferase family pro
MAFLISSTNVFNYLVENKICQSQEQSLSKIELKSAKNFNLLISLPDGRQLLVKQERHDQNGKTLGEFIDEWRIHDFCQQFPEINYLRASLSEAIHFDSENSIIVFNYLNEYQDLAEFYAQEQEFPPEISQVVGTTIAAIHRLTIDNKNYQKFFENSLKSPNITKGLDRITPEIFGKVTADGLRFFSLYQRYDNLGKAIAELNQNFTPCCLTHNDLKLNNILLSLNWETEIEDKLSGNKNIIRLIDWERGSWGDPANDLGTIIASYLQIWLYSIVSSKTIPIEECLRLAAIPLSMIQPSLSTLVNAYLTTFPEILELRPDFLQLVMQFSGLALIRAIQARLQYEKTFDNTGICILQVAKSLLCRPQASISTILGMEFSTISSKNLSLV